MGASPRYTRCGFCGRRFKQNGGPGRRKSYCDKKCRRGAQRRRDGQDRAVPARLWPWGRDIAGDVHSLAVQLVEAEYQEAGLHGLLDRAARITREVGCYEAAAVQDARNAGRTWEEIAAAAGVGVETARARWGDAKVKRLLARRAADLHAAPPKRPGGQGQTPCTKPDAAAENRSAEPLVVPSKKLGAALSHLQRTSGTAISDAARQADLSPSYLSRILTGERVPAWPVTHMLATIFGGSPAEVRILWEGAHGIRHLARQSIDGAAGRLNAALRGLYLAAACPDLVVLAENTGLSAGLIDAVLRGDHVPDWPTTAHLVRRLAVDPAVIRPLWEAVHYAFLTSHDIFPAGGLPRSTPAARHETSDEPAP
ncbi:helix-turn-helix transcriptional regulator [Streptomyces sp. NPDC094034]|uniref:helix-turn-helix domain-containing protein n=1 Tax=Streptomyces sp. NPDC094034 TaxID=3155309 RepID=UPI0033299892